MGGIWLESNTYDINVSSNTITMAGYNNAGIWIWGSNHSVDSNTINTSGEWGDGIYMSDGSGTNLTSNTINISGNASYGIYSIMSENSPLLFYNNVITTSANHSDGIHLQGDSNNNISSNNITTSGYDSFGIYFNESHNTTLAGNIIETGEADSYVLYFWTASGHNVYNNIFNTSTSGSGVYINDSDLNYFNTTNSTSDNIIGRTYTGGNFWTNINGNGYSDTCINLDSDYFCDNEYTIVSERDERDYLPLANTVSWAPSCATLDVENKSYYLNQSLSSNGTCFNITANGVILDFNGYNITGNSTGYGVNFTGYNDTTILDGFIYNFSVGIYLGSNTNNTITNMTSNNNSLYGIAFSTSSNNTLTTIIVNNNSHGINLVNSDNNIFTSVTTNLNILLGLYLSVSSANIFTNFNMSDSGISLDNATSNTFTHFDINDSLVDAVTLVNEASDNNFTDVVMVNTSSSHYDINFSTAGIDGTWIEGIEFTNYSFAGAGGKVNFKEPGFGEIVFLEAINGSGNSLKVDVDVEDNSVFVDSSSNSGLNKSANISFYSVSFMDPKPQYSSDGVTYADCTASTNPACVEFAYTVGGTFKFNVSHFTYFKIIEGYSAPATTPSSGGVIRIPTYSPTKEKLQEGYTRFLRKNYKVKFDIGSENHTLNVDSIDDDSINITISSEPQTKTLFIGDEVKFELDGDSLYDFSVKLNSISGGGAELLMKTISEEIPEGEVDEVDDSLSDDSIGEGIGDVVDGAKKSWVWIIGVVVLLVVVIGAVVYFRKRQ